MDDSNKKMNQTTGVSESEFNMWRAVFAFALVDNILSLEEQRLLQAYESQVPFSPAQLRTLSDDFKTPQDIHKFYDKITEDKDKKRFCVLARAVVWSEGDMNLQEAEILERVACMNDSDRKILAATRGHVYIEEYYHQYAKTGVIGLSNMPHMLHMQV